MNFTVKLIGACPGNCHVDLQVTLANGKLYEMNFAKDDFIVEPDEIRQAIPILLKSFVKESGLTNWVQIKSALETHTFKV